MALIWLPLIKCILRTQIKPKAQIIVVARTKWRANNLLMVSVIWEKRAWPVFWQFLPKKGSSNLAQPKTVLPPVLRLLKHAQIVVVGDREFHSIERELLAWGEEGIFCSSSKTRDIY